MSDAIRVCRAAAILVLAWLLTAAASPQASSQTTAQTPPAQTPAVQAPLTPVDQAQKPEQKQGQEPEQKPEQKQEEEAAQLPRVNIEVVVTAPRLDVPLKDNPAATTVLPSSVLRTTMPRAIGAEEAMRLVPGVKVDNQADGERVHLSIRGQGVLTERGIRGIAVLLDGLPLNDPTGFAPDLFDVDWSTIQQIEVFRGPASTLYGGRSAGGVINITTRDGDPNRTSGEATMSVGSYTFWKPFAEVGGTNGSLNYRISASGNHGDGYRDHTAFDAANLYGKFRWTLGEKTRLTAIVAGTHFWNQNAEGLNVDWLAENRQMANPDALTYNEYQLTNRITTGLVGDVKIAANQELSFAVSYRHTDWQESVPSTVQDRQYHTPLANVEYTVHGGTGRVRNHLAVGMDLDGQWIGDQKHLNLGDAREGPDLVTDQDIRQHAEGVFALDRIELGPQWGVMLGVRGDHIYNKLNDNQKAGGVDLSGEQTFSQATGRVGVSWSPRSDFGMYVNWGQGFMPPATEELANNPDHLGGFNMNLVPATSHGEEIGVRGVFSNEFAYDATFFRLDTDNDFGRYRVPGRPLETFYQNAGSSRRYGFETSLGWFPTPAFSAQVAYTYSDFIYTNIKSLFGNFTDKVMPNAPRHQAGVDAQYTWRDRWFVGVSMDMQSLQYVDQTNLVWIDGFVLVDPRVGFRWKGSNHRGEIELTSRNVFGKEYIAFTEPDPDGNSFQPGPTREVFLGLHVWMGR